MAASAIACPGCGDAVPYGRLSCPSCGELLALVAGGSRRLAGSDRTVEAPRNEAPADVEPAWPAAPADEPVEAAPPVPTWRTRAASWDPEPVTNGWPGPHDDGGWDAAPEPPVAPSPAQPAPPSWPVAPPPPSLASIVAADHAGPTNGWETTAAEDTPLAWDQDAADEPPLLEPEPEAYPARVPARWGQPQAAGAPSPSDVSAPAAPAGPAPTAMRATAPSAAPDPVEPAWPSWPPAAPASDPTPPPDGRQAAPAPLPVSPAPATAAPGWGAPGEQRTFDAGPPIPPTGAYPPGSTFVADAVPPAAPAPKTPSTPSLPALDLAALRTTAFQERVVVVGGAIATVAFFLPWASAVIGSPPLPDPWDSFGIVGAWHLVPFLLTVGTVALSQFGERFPVWFRLALAPLFTAGVLLGLGWYYLVTPLGGWLGGYVLAAGAVVMAVGATLAIRGLASRNAEPPPHV